MTPHWEDFWTDDEDDVRPRRHRTSCSDMTCGADDCRTCRPLSPADDGGDSQTTTTDQQ